MMVGWYSIVSVSAIPIKSTTNKIDPTKTKAMNGLSQRRCMKYKPTIVAFTVATKSAVMMPISAILISVKSYLETHTVTAVRNSKIAQINERNLIDTSCPICSS